MSDGQEESEQTDRLRFDPESGGEETFFVHEDVHREVAPPAEGRTLGRFKVLRPHAQGGLGRISVARDAELGRDVALKEIRPDITDPEGLVLRFVSEARITGGLEHPGVVPIYALGRDEGGRPFYAMRFVEGEALGVAIARHHRERTALGFTELLRRFISVCETIAYAHDRGVIHRDLKPDNVMLGSFGETLVVDWGLAKRLGETETGGGASIPGEGSDVTLDGQVIGTPAFMSPEQAAGAIERVGTSADVYALGAILYVVLSNRAPFRGSSREVVEALRSGAEPSSVDVVAGDAPPALRAICRKAMAAATDDRYASAREVADEVRRFLADEPVEAYAEPWSARAARWIRRHRAMVLSSMAILIVIVISLAVATFLLDRARGREADARAEEARQRRLAEASYTTARAALDEFVELRKDPLLRRGELEDLRRRMAGAEAGFFRRFLEIGADDPELRFERARALRMLASATRELATAEDAVPHLREADAIFTELLAATPADERLEFESLATLNSLGEICRLTGRDEEAIEVIQRAVGVADGFAQARPEVAGSADRHAGVLQTLGTYYYHRGDLDDAVACYGRALDEAERAMKLGAGITTRRRIIDIETARAAINYRRGRVDEAVASFETIRDAWLDLAADSDGELEFDLARATANLASGYQSVGRAADARDTHREALEIFETLAEEHPKVVEYREMTARTLRNLSLSHRGVEAWGAAESCLARAISILTELVADHPTNAEFAHSLAKTRVSLGRFLQRRSRPDDALGAYRTAREELEHLLAANPRASFLAVLLAETRNGIGGIHVEGGRPAEAEESHRGAIGVLRDLPGARREHNARIVIERSTIALMDLCRDAGRPGDAARALADGAELLGEAASPEFRKYVVIAVFSTTVWWL